MTRRAPMRSSSTGLASVLVFHVLQRVAACCSVLQRVAACCSVLQRVAACYSVFRSIAVFCSVIRKRDDVKQQCVVAMCCSVLHWSGFRADVVHVAACRSVLQCVVSLHYWYLCVFNVYLCTCFGVHVCVCMCVLVVDVHVCVCMCVSIE